MTHTRNDLLRQVQEARTLPEMDLAKRAQQEWLREHPDDMEVLLDGEQLDMVEAALREIGDETQSERV